MLWLLDTIVYTRGIPKAAIAFFLLSQVLIGYGLIIIHGQLREFLGITGANPLRFGLLSARLCSLIWVLVSLMLNIVLWLVGIVLFPVFVIATICMLWVRARSISHPATTVHPSVMRIELGKGVTLSVNQEICPGQIIQGDTGQADVRATKIELSGTVWRR